MHTGRAVRLAGALALAAGLPACALPLHPTDTAATQVLALHPVNGLLVIATPDYITRNCGRQVMACTIRGARDVWLVPPPPLARFDPSTGGGPFGDWLRQVGAQACPGEDPVRQELCGHEIWHTAVGPWH